MPTTLSTASRAVRGSAIRDLLALTSRPEVISLAGGLPAPDLMPRERIAAAAATELVDASPLQYGETAGLARPREVVTGPRPRRPCGARPRGRRRRGGSGLRRCAAGVVGCSTPTGGMFCWLRFPPGTDTDALSPRALAHGVGFVPGAAFAVHRPLPDTARCCFASHPEDVVTEAVRRLALAVSRRAPRALHAAT